MKKRKFTKILTCLLCALLMMTLLTACEEKPKGTFSSFSADTLDGGTFTQDDLKDYDLTVIHFWGTFCAPCREEMPRLADYEKTLPDNVQLVTICIDAAEEMDDAKKIMADAGFEGITMVGGNDTYQDICNSVQVYPMTVFVDSKGNLGDKAIVGGQEKLAETYTKAINLALKSLGKDEISVPAE